MPLGRALERAQLDHHSFADDSQVYNTFVPQPTVGCLEGLCVVAEALEIMRSWFGKNMLKLNNNKTEVLAITPKTKPKIDISITIGDSEVKSKVVVRNWVSTLTTTSQWRHT
jgi:hypothetical protein